MITAQTLSATPSLDCFTNYPFESANEVMNRPATEWLIQDVLPARGLSSVYGPSGAGKSFLCLDMGLAVVLGSEWFGHECKQRSVIYLAFEGGGGLAKRLRAYEENRIGEPLPESIRFDLTGLSLSKEANLNEVLTKLAVCKNVGLVIIDTLNRAFPGADENSASEMGKIIEIAKRIESVCEGMVLLVHHTGKDATRGLRGHSSLFAALDSVIEVTSEADAKRWKLAKSKDGEDGLVGAFKLKKVDLTLPGDSVCTNSCVIEEIANGEWIETKKGNLGQNQKAVLNELERLLDELAANQASDTQAQMVAIDRAEAIELLRGVIHADAKHQRDRVKGALTGLIRNRYVFEINGKLTLPKFDADLEA